MQGLWNRKHQLNLITPFIPKYYAVLHDLVETCDREFVEEFMEQFSPAFMGRDEDLNAFK